MPTVIDLVDVDSQKWLDYGAAGTGPRSWLYRLEGRRLRKLEQTLPSWALAVTLVSEAEVDIYRRFAAPGLVQAIPNGVDLDYFQPMRRNCQGAEEPACAFVGRARLPAERGRRLLVRRGNLGPNSRIAGLTQSSG